MKRHLLLSLFSATALSLTCHAQVTVPIDGTVDTGSHTCTSQGQDVKVYKTFYAGDGRYFVDANLSVVSMFREGNCEFITDSSEPNIETKKFKFVDADGNVEWMEKPVRYTVRAYGDCTNNLQNIGKRMGTECRFKATSKRGVQ